jgi:hypothetical protein
MKYIKISSKVLLLCLFVFSFTTMCTAQDTKSNKSEKKAKKGKVADIDLNHWSVTTPEINPKTGKVTNVEPPEILNYADNPLLKKNMYDDPKSGALVFYAYPAEGKTANTKYSRSELREQMVSGDNNTNWTFKQGGTMKGELAMGDVSRDSEGKYHKVIIMQIHGRLTDEQKKLSNQDDNNAPPMLKIYWQDGKIRVKTKVLNNPNATYEEMLHEDAWGDDKGYTFKEEVGFSRFLLEVKVTDGKMVVSLNNNEFKVYDDINMRKWGIFENYFKAGNYFQSRDEGSFAKVNYYMLSVTH